MSIVSEKGGGSFHGNKRLLCENPLPPIATLQHEDQTHARAAQLHGWTVALAAELRALGVRTYPTHTYFFLADLVPHGAEEITEQLRRRDILIKPLNDAAIGPGFMRVTTALPEDNRRFVDALCSLLT